ncbi:MAG: Tricarboxylate transport sensor protein TctE [bacterium]|nr:Tricarboxylate transport sensor protein TctE [bacterium]
MPRGLLTRLVVSFGLAILSFCGSTLYSQSISRDIDDAALSISGNAMVSIEHLTDTRGELRQLDVAIAHFDASHSDADRAAVAAARSRLDESFERYLAEPETYPGEQALWADMHRALSAVNQAVENALDDGANGRAVGARVTRAIDIAAVAVRRTIDFNADQARALALRIERDHHRATRVALLLDLLSTLFTIVAGYTAVRALAHHHRVVDERNRLVARRAEELEQFAGRVAHDILGPLSATRLAVSHAATQLSDPAIKRTLERGQRGVDRVATIVDGLLRFARAGARPEPGVITSVAPVVQAVVSELEPVAQEAQVTLTLAPIPPCAIFGHAGVLSSIVENLTRNAIKYMGERSVRRVELRVEARERFVRFEVVDSGPGIPPSLVDTVFDPHVRGNTQGKPGIGLGLATVKRIADAHGGRVGVISRLDEGTTFWCELPRADYDEDSRANRASAQAAK